MYSTPWMNQPEIKDTCFEFVINNVSPQGNNVKIKLILKVEKTYRDCRAFFFCEISHSVPRFFHKPMRHIHNPIKHQYAVFCKNNQLLNIVNYFCKKLHLRCFTGF